MTARLEHFGVPGDPRPWVRVANMLIDRIEAGQYADGFLPGRDALAAELGVSATAVQRAFRQLCEREILSWVPGRGHFVIGTSEPRGWLRVMNGLLDQIAGGELKPHDRVPAVEVLRVRYRCSIRKPVSKALRALEREGILRRIRGAGYEVIPPGDRPPSPEEAAARQKLTEALQWMWDGAYKISASADGKLEAWRMDGSGTLHADTPEELRDAIRQDYALRPVKEL